MTRKLFACFILLGVFAFFALVYLYFFVYYTAQVHIDSNVDAFQIEFFSKSTTLTKTRYCTEKSCNIDDIAPLTYNIALSKPGYKTQNIHLDLRANKKHNLVVTLEKEAILEKVILSNFEESPQERITRLRGENRYYSRFALGDASLLLFQEQDQRLKMLYQRGELIQPIADFELIPKDEIYAEYISGSESVFIRLANDVYIFDTIQGRLFQVDIQIPILYIKPGTHPSEYNIITEKGVFIFDIRSGESRYQYLFRDYIEVDTFYIGIIFQDELQKRRNFHLEDEPGNLIIKYHPQEKTRKVIYATDQNISRIEYHQGKVILTLGEQIFELQNY